MYTIIFFKRNGESTPKLLSELEELRKDSAIHKDSRINYQSIVSYIEALKVNGLKLPQKYIKKIKNDLWELRRRDNRILFFAAESNKFVLLHMFKKKTRKTPAREINKALSEIKVYKEGGK